MSYSEYEDYAFCVFQFRLLCILRVNAADFASLLVDVALRVIAESSDQKNVWAIGIFALVNLRIFTGASHESGASLSK
jgi:hypothetical protein